MDKIRMQKTKQNKIRLIVFLWFCSRWAQALDPEVIATQKMGTKILVTTEGRSGSTFGEKLIFFFLTTPTTTIIFFLMNDF
jgi:hypothetical protein